ncbi:dual specificity protein phosphatase family protein [Gemmata sp. G18]|uniref:Dual specificity protein phosphatase family protein n=1 Tax=Gemmata palustris TaxID=2822762 RepID=A0ABS5BPW6_9BACT|nr:dual specificity protein phosphatase family protein [Gemmata palustris]MBP3955758.1 dual specificity protein phosphatase family protein [Gemmata palustris]
MEPKNTEIRIAGYTAASLLLERELKQWHALVLLDSNKQATNFVQEHTPSHLYLRFDDIEEPRADKQTPTRAQIAQAIEFAQGKDKLLVSCRAGRGRSVALAYLICCRERGVTEALKLLDPTRHRPNRLVISLGDTLLDALYVLDSFDDWHRRHAHVQLSDYYDEMEKEFEALEAQGASNRICGP